MKLSSRVWIIFAVGIVAVSLIAVFNFFVKHYFIKNNFILTTLNDIESLEDSLNYELIKGSLFLYTNNDNIGLYIKKIEQNINKLKNDLYYKTHYDNSYKELLKYEKLFLKKKGDIYEYLRYSIPLKNAMTYLIKSLEYLDLENKKQSRQILDIVSKIFLARGAIDLDFLKNITKDEKLDKNFLINLNVILNYFPKYKKFLTHILNSKTKKALIKAKEEFILQTKKDTDIFDYLSMVMIIFISGLILALINLIHKLEQEINKVKYLAEHDMLTGAYNRLRYDKDRLSYNSAGLILFNIDKFKFINDYFGSHIGDEILKQFSKELQKLKKEFKNAKIYRFGADDFGILFENEFTKEEIKRKLLSFIEEIEKKDFITTDDFNVNINISAGVSCESPLFENADMALKNGKGKVNFYERSLNYLIKENLKKSIELKKALSEDKILIYYQPIFNSSLKIVKYEVLCRIEVDGEIKSIYPYLDIAKKNKTYHLITKKVLNLTLKTFKEYPQVKLSVNFDMDDIEDEETLKILFEDLKEFHDRLTIEILETEIENYSLFEDFVKRCKKRNIEIALDDFGSGYSNFQRVLNLDIDYFKIDGSLIKELASDKKSLLLVDTIVNFVKKIDKKCVAEFVHSREVFEIAKFLGIEYFQGYYLSPPEKNIKFL